MVKYYTDLSHDDRGKKVQIRGVFICCSEAIYCCTVWGNRQVIWFSYSETGIPESGIVFLASSYSSMGKCKSDITKEGGV